MPPPTKKGGAFSFEIRTAGDPSRVANTVRKSLSAADENLSVLEAQTLDQKIGIQSARTKLIADISTVFGLVALVLAVLGIYAVLSYNVARRTNEFGIRMALGAGRSGIIDMVLWQIALMIVTGLIVGVIVGGAATRVLASQVYGVTAIGPRWSLARYEHVDSAAQLYGITALDLPTIAVTICILIASALVAAWIPAVRAADVDPASALRQE